MRITLMLALAASLVACNKDADNDEDGFPASEDCNDEDASINPDADEVCDGVDNNCDAITDVDATDAVEFYGDADGDGFGGDALTFMACEAPEGFFATNDDCDDTNADVNPNGAEICDGLDNDCDGALDDADDSVDLSTITDWYPDFDGDGYGDDSDPTQSCSAPAGHVIDGGDCDDIDPLLNPATVWYADVDGDGYGSNDFTTIQCEQPNNHTFASADCDDSNPNINPDALEVCDNGADNDCDGLIDDDDDSLDLDTRTLWYPDADTDGYGDSADAGTLYCNGPSGTANNGEDCDDVDNTVSPDATEVCEDGIDNDCSGDAPECGLSGSTTTASADVSISGNSSSDYFARRVAIFDGDNDGNDDFFAGAYLDDDNGSSSGSAFAFYGPITGSVSGSSADWQGTGERSSDYYGYDVDSAGDLNGDGYPELLVGAYGNDDGASSGGKAYLYLGSASGYSTDADLEMVGNSSSDYFGHTVKGVGDIDGDGADDFSVGAYGDDDGSSTGGGVFIWLGVPTSTQSASDADIQIYGDDGDYLGYLGSVNSGDFDGDGSQDLVTGGYYALSDYGGAFVNYGPITGGTIYSEDSDVVLEGTGTYDYFGRNVAVGDLNDDGYDDMSVGEYYGVDASSVSTGVNYVFFGTTSGWSSLTSATDADISIDGKTSYDYFGSSVEIGDLNGDGTDDLMVGAGGNDDGGTSSGANFVFFGPLSADSTYTAATADATISGSGTYQYCGYYDVGIGDLDGDGVGDYVNEIGRAHV